MFVFPPWEGEAWAAVMVWESSGLWKGLSMTAVWKCKLGIYNQNSDFGPRWEKWCSWEDMTFIHSLGKITFIHFSHSILLYSTSEFTSSSTYPCSWAPNVCHDTACCFCFLPSVGFVFDGSTSVELSESTGGIFRTEPCTLHLFSSFLIQKHHRNSLLPSQEIICKSFLIYMVLCYISPAPWLSSVRTDKLSNSLPLFSS